MEELSLTLPSVLSPVPLRLGRARRREKRLQSGRGSDSLYDLAAKLTDNHWPP